MKRMVVVSLLFCSGVVFFPGCSMPSDQRFEMLQQMIVQTQEESSALNDKIVAFDSVLAEAQAALSDPNLTSQEVDEIQAIIDEIMAGSQQVAAKKAEIDAAIGRWRAEMDDIASGGDVGLGEEMQAWGTGLTQVGPLIPGVGIWAVIGGSLLTAVGGALSSKKSKAVTKGVVGSVSELLASDLVPNTDAAKKLLRKYQEAASIRESVDKLR